MKPPIVVGRATPVLVCLLLGGACDGPGEPDDIQVEQQPVLNGTTVTSDTWGTVKLVGKTCSGTLPRDRWLLTAQHCLAAVGTTIQLRNGASATLTNPIINHPTLDLTIARVASSLVPEGSAATNGPWPFYRGSMQRLVNKTLYCQGWGIPDFGTVLRSANLMVDALDPPNGFCGEQCYRLTINTGGQLMSTGDSGSSCLLKSGHAQKHKNTGVMVKWDGVAKDFQIAAPWFRDWATGIFGAAPSVGIVHGYERADARSGVTYVNPSSRVIELVLTDSGWARQDLTSSPGAVTAVGNTSTFIRFDGFSSTAYRSSDNHIRVLEQGDGAPNYIPSDVSAQPSVSAPLAAGDPANYGRADRTGAIVYRGTDNRIIELSIVPGFGWGSSALTSDTSGSGAAASDPVGYVRDDGKSAVIFRSSDNHIREVSLPFGGTWQPDDLTASAVGGAPNATGKPFPYTRSDGVSAVLFRPSDNTVRALERSLGTWFASTLPMHANAPTASADPVGYVRSDGLTAVIYKGTNNRLYEIHLSAGGWIPNDLLSASSGSPPLATGTGLGAYVRADRANIVLYRTSDNHMHELSMTKGGSWQHADITNAAGGTI